MSNTDLSWLSKSFDIPPTTFQQEQSRPLYACHFVDTTPKERLEILAFRNHPETSAWMVNQHISLEAHLQFIEQLKTNTSSAYYLFKQENTLLGVGSLTRVHAIHRHAFLGIYKNPNLQRVGAQILDALEFIAFYKMRLHALHLEVLSNNQRALHFYQRHAYRKEGFLRDFIYRDGHYHDVWLFVKLSPFSYNA
ncbi:UDP-4-amino-4,6-dideoxy-N-acetyl-beta-L-altrosamine N-acetyltransferase [Helicobacter baculiformis]|uniref:UDP-4-amino-4, 6-dideoxy-N-acetyl-beta-L-altrosamine N-acetyltransferase n=1 Tax=Helicobacter baculiformis TaxID=427351 RepID=A0ABV7ZID7_9HELI|nr:UDP-4-amino-4,6-dideoxy-N-acetyl-beta-L-altrosamine N-acetyltransferase [Helicobacter baculiformis]